MHDGKFLHLSVVDRDGLVSIVDVLHITHAAIATVGKAIDVNNEGGSSMMQKFWDSAMALTPIDDDDETRSESLVKLASENGETGKSPAYSSSVHPNSFAFKIQDKMGRMHRFICDSRSLIDLITAIVQRVGGEIDPNNLPQILYEDEDQDKVVISSDNDLTAAVEHACLAGRKGLKLHLDYSGGPTRQIGSKSSTAGAELGEADAWASAYSAATAGAALLAGIGVLAILKRSGN